MNAKKCDRCGKYYEEYNLLKGTNGICFCKKFYSSHSGFGVSHDLCIDLCPECMADVKAFVKTDTNTFIAEFNKKQIKNWVGSDKE